MEDIIKKRKEIIAQLISERMSQNISQSELAKMLGLPRSNVCRLESGTHSPSIDLLIRTAEALGKDFNVMLSERSDDQMAEIYELRLYDEALLEFSLEEKGLKGLVADIKYVNEEKKHLLPLGFEETNEGVIKWLEKRVIPKNRAFVDEILKTLGLSVNDTKGIIDVCKGLSLNDSYWVVPFDFEGKFEDMLEDAVADCLKRLTGSAHGTEEHALVVMSRDGSTVTKTRGEGRIRGPVTLNGAQDRWIVVVIDTGGREVIVGDYDTKEEAQPVLRAIMDAFT